MAPRRKQGLPNAKTVHYALYLVVLASVTSSNAFEYPTDVHQVRVDPTTFVTDPNVVDDVRSISVSRIRPAARRNEVHISYGLKVDKEFKCRTSDYRKGKWVTIRTDLPGILKCGERNSPLSLYLIPRISVERGRFFNVSLDFVQLKTESKLGLPRAVSTDPPLVLELSPSGIMFLSGLFVNAPVGPMMLAIDVSTAAQTYRFKIHLEIEDSVVGNKDQRIDVLLNQSTFPDQRQTLDLQLDALKCMSEVLSIPQTSLHQLTFETANNNGPTMLVSGSLSVLSADAQQNVIEPCDGLRLHRSNINDSTSCIGFAVDRVNVNGVDCSNENESDAYGVILTGPSGEEDNEFDSGNPLTRIHEHDNSAEEAHSPPQATTAVPFAVDGPSVVKTTIAATTTTTTTTEVSESRMISAIAATTTTTPHVSIELQSVEEPGIVTTSAPFNRIYAENDLQATQPSEAESTLSNGDQSFGHSDTSQQAVKESSSSSVMAGRAVGTSSGRDENAVRGYNQADPKHTFLRTTEFYSITALASIPLVVAFALLFYKMATCRQKGEYDPVLTSSPRNGGLSGEPVYIDTVSDTMASQTSPRLMYR